MTSVHGDGGVCKHDGPRVEEAGADHAHGDPLQRHLVRVRVRVGVGVRARVRVGVGVGVRARVGARVRGQA